MSDKITLHIEGMTCNSCADHVKQSPEILSGVRSVSVSYPQRQAEIEIHAGVSADVFSLVTAVPSQTAQRANLMACWKRCRIPDQQSAGITTRPCTSLSSAAVAQRWRQR